MTGADPGAAGLRSFHRRIVVAHDAASAGTGDASAMDTLDISELARQVEALDVRAGRRRMAVVVPLEPGKREIAEAVLSEGPPFDPRAYGIDRHEVFLTDDEAIFVFEAEQGLYGLERILAENEFWEVLPAWEHTAAGPPRLAERAYGWTAED